jgi:rhodanese-related sulfurtransferase
MEDKRYIKKRYIFINVIMIGLTLWLLLLPKRDSSTELQADKLLLEIIDDSRFLSTDYVANRIINDDKYILLVDVRSPEEFNTFHLKGAMNIPIDSLLNKDETGEYVWDSYLNTDIYKVIFYSNGSVYSGQAWMLTKRLNFKNNYILKGGLNEWFSTIMLPQKPAANSSESDFAIYEARKGAAIYFGGGTVSVENKSSNSNSNVPVVSKKKKSGAGGGC